MAETPTSPPWWRPSRRWLPHWSTVLLVAAIAYLWWHPWAWISNPMQPAPPINAPLLNGSSFDLRQHRGEVVLINVWAPWCPPCRREMPAITAYYQKHRGQRFTVLSLADDELAPVRDYVQKERLPFPVGLYANAAGAQALGEIKTIPTSFIIDRQGRIVHRITGPLYPGRLRDLIDPLLSGTVSASAKSRS